MNGLRNIDYHFIYFKKKKKYERLGSIYILFAYSFANLLEIKFTHRKIVFALTPGETAFDWATFDL